VALGLLAYGLYEFTLAGYARHRLAAEPPTR
jgi:hypothetical protein